MKTLLFCFIAASAFGAVAIPPSDINPLPTATLVGRTAAGTGAATTITAGTSLSLAAGAIDAIQDIRTSASPTFAAAVLSGTLTSAGIDMSGSFTTSGSPSGVYLGINAAARSGSAKLWLVGESQSFGTFDIFNQTNGTRAFYVTGAGAGGVAGSWTIGGGTAIAKVLSATATLNFGSILVAASEDLTITVTGAAAGDRVGMGLPATVLSGAVFNAWVSSANTVTVRCNNAGSIAIDPASAIYAVMVVQF